MKCTVKIYSVVKQSQRAQPFSGKKPKLPRTSSPTVNKGHSLENFPGYGEKTLFTTSYFPDTDNFDEGVQMCHDYALYLMGKRKLIGISRGISVPSSLYFSIEFDGFTYRSDSSETLSQWKGLFKVPTSKLVDKDGKTTGSQVVDKYIGIMTNRLKIAEETILSVPEAQSYADRKQAERKAVNSNGELVNA